MRGNPLETASVGVSSGSSHPVRRFFKSLITREEWVKAADDPVRAWIAWFVLIGVAILLVIFGPERTVTSAYRPAAEAWVEGEDLYNSIGSGFLYLPQAAILFIPFEMLPHTVGEIAWRMMAVGVFVWGVHSLARVAGQQSEHNLFVITTLFTIPLAFAATRNGQSTLPMAGLMMLAAADLANRRWTRAAILLCSGMAMKPLIMVMILLSGAMYRPVRGRLALGLLVTAACPLLTQSPAYVLEQYLDCGQMLVTATGMGQTIYWAQPFSALEILTPFEIPRGAQMLIRIGLAGATLLLCLVVQKRCNEQRTAIFLFSIAACYLLLMNPRTESNTYALGAPALGMSAALAFWASRRREFVFLVTLAIATLCTFELGKFFTEREQSVWLAPIAFSIFTASLAVNGLRERSDGGRAEPETDQSDIDEPSQDLEPIRLAA